MPLAAKVPTLIVIPGREQLAMAHMFPWYNRWYNQLLVPAFCRSADALITHAEIGREDCIMMGARPERITVIPHGVDPYLRPAPEEAKRALKARLGLTRPYILFLGGITPLKNIGNLLRAFALLAQGHDVNLVLAGFKRWSFERELAPIAELGLQDRVKYVGYLPDEDLAALYSAAECLALPSWYEGFGIPRCWWTRRTLPPSPPGSAGCWTTRSCAPRTAEVIESLVARPQRREGAWAAVKRGVVRGTASASAVVTERIAGGFYQK